MKTLTRTKTILAGLSALSLLAVSACSTESEASVNEDSTASPAAEEQSQAASAGAVYDFSAVADSSSSDELRIEIPEQLIEAASEYAENRVLDGITAKGTTTEDSDCAIEISFDYADGAQERIGSIQWRDQDTVEDTQLATESRYAGSPGAATVMVYSEGVERVADADVFSEDFATAIVPVSCAPSPSEGDFVTVGFVDLDESRDYSPAESIATVSLNVMASGDIHVVNANVEGYQYSGDEHGWIGNDQTVDSQGNVIDG